MLAETKASGPDEWRPYADAPNQRAAPFRQGAFRGAVRHWARFRPWPRSRNQFVPSRPRVSDSSWTKPGRCSARSSSPGDRAVLLMVKMPLILSDSITRVSAPYDLQSLVAQRLAPRTSRESWSNPDFLQALGRRAIAVPPGSPILRLVLGKFRRTIAIAAVPGTQNRRGALINAAVGCADRATPPSPGNGCSIRSTA